MKTISKDSEYMFIVCLFLDKRVTCIMNRREFAKGCAAVASAAVLRRVVAQQHKPTGDSELDRRQSEIDAITPRDFAAYWMPHNLSGLRAFHRLFTTIFRLSKYNEKMSHITR